MKKKGLLTLIVLLLLSSWSWAAPLRTQNSVPVSEGYVVENSIVADSKGQIFLEFMEDTYVIQTEDLQAYEGDIMPPEIIPLPDAPPRPRMKEVLSFELLGQTDMALHFLDRFDVMPMRLRRRIAYKEGDMQRRLLVQALVVLEEKVHQPALWEYLGEEDGWQRVGGRLIEGSNSETTEESPPPSDTEEMKPAVFSIALQGTGTFTLFEENPAPTGIDPFIPFDIELAERAPYASVAPTRQTSPSETEDAETPNEIPAISEEHYDQYSPEDFPPRSAENDEIIPAIPQESDPVRYEDSAGIEIPALVSQSFEEDRTLIPALPETSLSPETTAQPLLTTTKNTPQQVASSPSSPPRLNLQASVIEDSPSSGKKEKPPTIVSILLPLLFGGGALLWFRSRSQSKI